MISIKFSGKKIIDSTPDFTSGLEKTNTVFDFLPEYAIDSSELLPNFKKYVPSDGREVVNWMHNSAAGNVIIDAYEKEYNKNSLVRGSSGDGYIPGVRVAGLSCCGEHGPDVQRRGYAVVNTPRGAFKVPLHGQTTFCLKDILAWACLPWAGTCQILISMLRWLELAIAPITNRIRFPGFNGHVAPNFFDVSTRVPSPVATLRIGLTSNRKQKVQIIGRGVKGAYENVLFRDSFDVDQGSAEYLYTIFGFPVVPRFTLELHPENNTVTVLDYLDIIP